MNIILKLTFARRKLLEPSRLDGVKFLMLPTMGDDFVGVSTHEVAFQAVEVRRLVLSCSLGKRNVQFSID